LTDIDDFERDLLELLDGAEPTKLRRALAHVAGRLAQAEGVPTAQRATRIVQEALQGLDVAGHA
jgi:hypothetical protein